MNNFEYALPQRLSDAFGFLKAKKSFLKAGGIDLLDQMKEGILAPKRLVNIKSLQELSGFSMDENKNLHLGPALTLSDLSENEVIKKQYRALAQAAGGVATPQIRNAATLGGNLCQRPRCWYFRSASFNCLRKGGYTCYAVDGENQYHAIFGNDDGCVIVHPSATAVALMALEAKMKISNEKSERDISIDDFFITPDQDITSENILKENEIITEIILPKISNGFRSFYFKQKEKQAFDWPIADVAVALTLKRKKCINARIVLGAAAPIPWRATKAEEILVNKRVTVKRAKRAANEAILEATPLSGNSYKVPVFKAIIYRTICWASGIDPFA